MNCRRVFLGFSGLLCFALFTGFGSALQAAEEKQGPVVQEGAGLLGIDLKKTKASEADNLLGRALTRLTVNPDYLLAFYKDGIKLAYHRKLDQIDTIVCTEFFTGKTSKGIGIGSPMSAVETAYGPSQSRTKDALFYNDAGIGFSFLNSAVKSITVFRPGSLEKSRPKQPAQKRAAPQKGDFFFEMKSGKASHPHPHPAPAAKQ